jgi:hypothetical protein
VSLVGKAAPLSGAGEWLARTGSCPAREVAVSGKLEGMAPASDACEKMTLSKAFQVGWSNIDN